MVKIGTLPEVMNEGEFTDTIKELPGKAWEGIKSGAKAGGRYIRDKYYAYKGEKDGKEYARKLNYNEKFSNPAYKKAYDDSFNRHNHMYRADREYRGLL